MLARIKNGVRGRVTRYVTSRGYFRDLWYPRYPFQMFPRQLVYLAKCLEETKDVPGAILEVGCAHGLTTTFLYEYLRESGVRKDYVCVDTFAGFTPEDLAVEFDQRGNRNKWIEGLFKDNNPQWFKEALAKRNIKDIVVRQDDITSMDDGQLPERISFCLLDVDLYQPVRVGLEKIYDRLSPGGIIVVDDCWVRSSDHYIEHVAEAYDGALQAYREFVKARGFEEELVETKFGVIRKPQ